MNLDDLKPEGSEPNPPAEPAYSAPKTEEVVLPEEPAEDDAFDEEVGTAEDVQADFDAEEQNAKDDELAELEEEGEA